MVLMIVEYCNSKISIYVSNVDRSHLEKKMIINHKYHDVVSFVSYSFVFFIISSVLEALLVSSFISTLLTSCYGNLLFEVMVLLELFG